MQEYMGVPDKKYQTYTLLGTPLHALTQGDLCRLINRTVSRGEKLIIGHHNLHSLYLYQHDTKMREFYARANFVYIDGMSIVLLGRFLGLPLRREHRVTLLDWFDPLMREASQQHWRVFFLGAKPEVASKVAEILSREFPGVQLQAAHGYFDTRCDRENESIVSKILAYQPHVLIVGMGMPRQEHWVFEELERLEANVILTAGGIIDYVVGVIPTPPRWIGRLGLEWLYRLITEPRRLWKRYLLEPWFVLALIFHEWIKYKTSSSVR